MKSKKGFTLIELIIGMIIISVISCIIIGGIVFAVLGFKALSKVPDPKPAPIEQSYE